MKKTYRIRPALAAAALATCGLAGWPAVAQAQSVQGGAFAVQATVLGLLGPTSSQLASTGTLNTVNGALDASLTTGSVPSLLVAEVLNAVTLSWTNQVDSEASLASLGMSIGGVGITADLVLARASSVLGAARGGSSTISGLVVNGVPVAVSGAPNQVVAIPGGQIVINEQTVSPVSTTVNALHVIVTGVADVVIASATAGIS